MTAALRVVKMSGAGNDFLVLGAEENRRLGPDRTSWIRRVCRRGLSVGHGTYRCDLHGCVFYHCQWCPFRRNCE